MRKVTEKTAVALRLGEPMKCGNTKVMGNRANAIMTLHDNVIATIERDENGARLTLTDSGWQTATTKERLNGVLHAFGSEWRIYQMDNKWYYTDGMGIRKDWPRVLTLEVA